MKEQFLNYLGLSEVISYIKQYIDDYSIKLYASYSVFPTPGKENIIYIDTTSNSSYYWNDTLREYKPLDVQTWDTLSNKPDTFPPSAHTHPYLGAKNLNGYYGIAEPDGTDNKWIRTTALGFIPYTSGEKGNGHGSLGDDKWYFGKAYIDAIYGNLYGNSDTATKLKTAHTINGVPFDGSIDITTTTWGSARNITIGNTKKSIDGSSDVSWTLEEIGAAAAEHTHNKADIVDFPESLKNPKGLRFLLPSRGDSLYWLDDYDNALNPGADIDYFVGENDRIKGDQSHELVYDGSQHPIINLAKLYQAGGVNYLTHTTSMKYIYENNGLHPYPDENNFLIPFPNDCNWNVFCVGYNINDGYQEDLNLHYNAARKYSGTGETSLYPSIFDDCLIAHAEYNRDSSSDNTFPKLIFYIDKSTFDDNGGGNCDLIYTFSFEIGYAKVENIIDGQKIGVKIFDEYDYQNFDDFNDDISPIYEEIWGINQTYKFYAGDKIYVSFLARFDRRDTQYHGIKIVFYGDKIDLAIKHPQLERGNIPSDWRPNIHELTNGTYENEYNVMIESAEQV